MDVMWRWVVIFGGLTLLAGSLIFAQDVETSPDDAPEPAAAAGRPVAPRSDDFDWVQLNNGEWLKGEIEDLQKDSFTFESDELDTVSLDWDDVYALYSTRKNTIVFQDKTTVEGTLKVEGDTVEISTEDGRTSNYPRDSVWSIFSGGQTELNYWSGKLSLGGTIRRGNVNQADLSLFARILRRDADSRFTLEYNGAYSRVEGLTTADNHRLTAALDWYLTRDFFLRIPSFEYYRDRFQNIDYRVTPGVGVGYDAIDRDRLEWRLGGGVGYQMTRFDSVPAGEPETTRSAALLFGTTLKWEATTKLDVLFEYALTVEVPEVRDYNFRATLGLEYEVWGDLDIDVRLIWDRVSNPAPAPDGVQPLPDDLRLFIGIGFEF